jgi:ABC-type uncharacterized transport system auxiliary subunit
MRKLHLASALALAALLGGCYSFRGGSAPAHLSTVVIPQVEDNSGSGRATMRQDLTQLIARKFREDNSLRVVDDQNADARIEVTIITVRDRERLAVSGQEYETVRGVTIEARATFRDNVRRRPIYADRTFTGRSQYNIDQGVAGEADAIAKALDLLSTEILLESVAAW